MAGTIEQDNAAHLLFGSSLSVHGGKGLPSRVSHRYISAANTGQTEASEGAAAEMSSFDEREKGFEAKYKHDQETQFKVTARRNKLLGLWAAEQLGLSGAEADAYAKSIVAADFEKPGDEDVLHKVMADLSAKGVRVTEHALRKRLADLAQIAREQIKQAG
jgi:hypothetical protein